jgi:hypothetical protein
LFILISFVSLSPPPPSSERNLRDVQQSEFEDAMQADREREEREAAEQRRAQQERAALEQQALAEQRELEAEAARAAEAERLAVEAAEELERERVRRLNELPPEPEASDKAAVHLQLRLPDGRQVTRRFLNSEVMQTIFGFVAGQALTDSAGAPIARWELIAQYPKRTLADGRQSLKDAGLVGRAVLFVQEIVAAE